MSRDGRKTGGKDWVKGKPGGPGRPALSPGTKQLIKLNHEHISKLISEIQGLPTDELVRIAKDPKSQGLQAAFASVMFHAIKHGDMGRLDKLLDRGAGKVKQIVQVEKQIVDSFEFTEEEREEDAD